MSGRTPAIDGIILTELKKNTSLDDIAKGLGKTTGAVRGRINKIITFMYKSGNDYETICNAVNYPPEDIKKAIKFFEVRKERQIIRKAERAAEKAERAEKMKDVEYVKTRLNDLQTQLIDIITELKEINKLVNTPK